MIPDRPRLASHVKARRHRRGDEVYVVLHDLRTGRGYRIGEREWKLLREADGTRDVTGIRDAALGSARATDEALRGFLSELFSHGLLVSGPPAVATEADDLRAPARPLHVLPGYRFRCDGSGVCCRQYGTVVFQRAEMHRAVGLLPLLEDGEDGFTPEGGSPSRSRVVAPTLVDGACAYLSEAGRCRIHEAGGMAAKPVPCRLFPRLLTDDGVAVRVSIRVECGCVLRSLDGDAGEPLVDDGVASGADVDPAIVCDRWPDRIGLGPAVTMDRATARLLVDELVKIEPPDAVAALWSLAAAADRSPGLALADPLPAERDRHIAAIDALLRAFNEPASLDPESLRPWVAALARRTAAGVRELATFRPPTDIPCRAMSALAPVAAALEDPAALAGLAAAPPTAPARESFYVRAALHGGMLFLEGPFPIALRDRAIRLLLARALPASTEPPFDEPIAMVESLMRGQGLASYTDDLR